MRSDEGGLLMPLMVDIAARQRLKRLQRIDTMDQLNHAVQTMAQNPRRLIASLIGLLILLYTCFSSSSSPTYTNPIHSPHLPTICRLHQRLSQTYPTTTPLTLFEFLDLNTKRAPFTSPWIHSSDKNHDAATDAIRLAWAVKKKDCLRKGKDTGLVDAVAGMLLRSEVVQVYMGVEKKLKGVSGGKRGGVLRELCGEFE